MPIQFDKVGAASVASTKLGSIDLGSVGAPPNVDQTREDAASLIGYGLLLIFGIATLYLFHLGALLFMKFNGSKVEDFAGFVRDALNPFLKECATTLGTIFGSALGFVLGYYFKAASSSKS